MNDNIIPFRPRAPRPAPPAGPPTAGLGTRPIKEMVSDPYAAAHDIQRELSSKFGFDVMLAGMPKDGDLLLALVSRLRDGLTFTATKHGASALLALNGVHVFFSCARNEISDDHGYRSLRLTNNCLATDVERLVALSLRNHSPRRH